MDEREELLKKDRERERRREELRRKREEEVQKKKRLAIIIGISVVVLIIVGTVAGIQISKKYKADKAAEKARQEKLAAEKEQEENTIEFLAVGDNIAHQPIRESGMQADGVWNYDHVYQYVKKDIEAADLSLVTQETVFVEDRNQVSGYPSFGTPPEFGDALVNTGFDVVAHATNHIMDKGSSSIEYTLDWWKNNHPETEIFGIHESQEAADEISVVTCKKLKLAMLDYTYSLNGIDLPSDKQYLVDLFDEDKAREDIKKAKELADVVIVVMHVGVEYDMDIDEETQQWVDLFLEEGVDIVIGSHPHVVRTMETLTGEDGHKMLVYYSLGNFTSTQNDLPSLLGAMAKITIRKDIKTGEIQIPEHEFIPLLMYYDRENPAAAIYKLEDYPDELIEKHSVYQANPQKFSKEYYEELFEEIKNKGNDEEI
nr:CapA family protein [uncultured Blautia sp.]